MTSRLLIDGRPVSVRSPFSEAAIELAVLGAILRRLSLAEEAEGGTLRPLNDDEVLRQNGTLVLHWLEGAAPFSVRQRMRDVLSLVVAAESPQC